MLDLIGRRQKDLLRLLLRHKEGLTVDELGQRLQITRNAVRQHLTALESGGLIAAGPTRPTGGRPTQVYTLSTKGRELFPRHYGWLAQLIIESIREEAGSSALRERLTAIGERVAAQLRQQHPAGRNRQERILKLAELMEQLGYNTEQTSVLQPNVISADNCVFHDLAQKNPDICQFDLALLSSYTESSVEHQECMAKGGNVCRFKFKPIAH
jgi:predicted ArsR family transcriptional regulator